MKQGPYGIGRQGIYYLVALFSLAAIGLLLIGAGPATADGYELPPRGDETETPETGVPDVPIVATGQGARIHLQAHFSQDWPWESMHWQNDLVLQVQWLDEFGEWQDVEGWQGSLDAIQQKEDWVGMKELWFADDRLGTGPYRWQVFVVENGRLLITSDQFYLPSKSGDLMSLDLMLKP
ncbi:MAG: hypothetical protein DHS20C20_04350 [Ardenticatenaceae bacterium]|nr:MAG: hypothetical protein DHS20C20_04350 [Ardenticatenaceae bacterium]